MTANGAIYASQQERLQARLADPRTADALERLLDKLDVVAFGVEAIDEFLRRSDQIAESLASSVRELKAAGGQGGQQTAADFVSALPQLARVSTQFAAATETPAFRNLVESALLEKLGDPQTIANLEMVLSKLELAAFAMQAIDGFIQRGDVITESIAGGLKDVRQLAGSIDFEKLKVLPQLLDSLPKLLESGMLDDLEKLTAVGKSVVGSGLLDPKLVATLADVGRMLNTSFEEARSAPPRTLGIFALARELRDPDVNRSIVLLLEVARRFGQKLS